MSLRLNRSNRSSLPIRFWHLILGNLGRVAIFAAIALASMSFALTTAALASVTGDPSEFNLCPINFTPANGQPLLCSHSETTGGTLTIGNSTVPINNNPDTVDFGAYGNSGLGFLGIEAIVTPTNGQIFGGPAQVVPGGLLGLTGILNADQRGHGLDRAGRSDDAGDSRRSDRNDGILLRRWTLRQLFGRTESVQCGNGADQGSSQQRRARSELLYRLGRQPDCLESGGNPDQPTADQHRRPRRKRTHFHRRASGRHHLCRPRERAAAGFSERSTRSST